ncbi:MAG: cytochrome B [Betaproteobacteria bacterium]|nr:cytochrome B [Betaproteobacteria bacterium]
MSPETRTAGLHADAGRLRVWDVPVRVFHWLLLLLVATSVTTAQIGGNAMEYHEWSGYAILALVLFRLLWGVVGSTYARFASFVRGPAIVLDYARALWRGGSPFVAGHNPLGGWMVLALLASLLLQACTGLFANDDIMVEGPLASLVSKDTSDLLTEVHEINASILLTLIAIHVLAVLFHLYFKRENLVRPMFSGEKVLPAGEDRSDRTGGPLWLAIALVAGCGLAVWFVVTR